MARVDFPKSHAVGRAIDREMGVEREVLGYRDSRSDFDGRERTSPAMNTQWRVIEGRDDVRDLSRKPVTVPATPEAAAFDGYGSALKPSYEPVVLAMAPLDGTFAHNALEHGVAGLNIDGSRISCAPIRTVQGQSSAQQAGQMYSGRDQRDRRPFENVSGRWPANLILSHHPECKRVGMKKVKGSQLDQVIQRSGSRSHSIGRQTDGRCTGYTDEDGLEEVGVWDCVEGCPIQQLDRMSGEHPGFSGFGPGAERKASRGKGGYHGNFPTPLTSVGYGDTGSVSRFFYCAKSSRTERNAGLDTLPPIQRDPSRHPDQPSMNDGEGNPYNRGCKPVRNDHPTVKAIGITKYLATLLLPPPCSAPRRILIPFSGSGSEAIGAMLAGWEEIVLIDNNPRYCEIAEARLKFWQPWAGTGKDPSDILADQADRRKREQAEAEAGVVQLSLLEDS